MYCPSCGTAVEQDAHFCRNCGHVLEPGGTAASAAATGGPGSPGEAGTPAASSASPSASSFEPYPTMPPPPPPPPGGPSYGGAAIGGPYSVFGQPLATWWQRVGAMLIDGILLAIPIGIVSAAINNHSSTTGTTQHGSSFSLILILVSAAYFGVLNGTGVGQTVGNRAPGIAVRDVSTGEVIGLGRGLLRWLVRGLLYIIVIPGIVNDLWPLWDAQRQTLADKAARSVMVKVR